MTNPVTYHQLNIAKIEKKTLETDQKLAQYRDEYFEENHSFIIQTTKEDLKKYVDKDTIPNMKFPPLDRFVFAFLDKLCNAYDREVVIRLLNDQNERVEKDDKNLVKINNLLRELEFSTFGHDCHMKSKLHNTILRQIRYNADLDKMYLQNGYNVGSSIVKSYLDYSLEPEYVAYEYLKKDNKYQYVVWDRKGELYFTNELKWDQVSHSFIGAKTEIKKGQGTDFKEYWPWIVQRNRNQNDEFWGHGFDAIVELVRFMYILLTVAGNDSIRQTIKLLIMNFDPTGNKTDDGKIKSGMENPILAENAVPGKGSDPKAEIISEEVNNEPILNLCYALADILGSLHNLPSLLKQSLQDKISGIHLRIQNEPILQAWAKEIIKVRKPDLETIETAIKMHNYHRGVKNEGDNAQKTELLIPDSVFGNISLDYQEPRIVTDPKEDLEIEVAKWEKGISNPILYVRTLNPDIVSDVKAEEFIRTNKEITAKLAKIGIDTRTLGSFKKPETK